MYVMTVTIVFLCTKYRTVAESVHLPALECDCVLHITTLMSTTCVVIKFQLHR